MSAETDLPINDAVPAPTKIEPGNLFLWNWRQVQVYAQACVAHAVTPLQAEIEGLREQLRLSTVDQVNAEAEANDARAEVEALRAEVETLRDGLDYLRQMQGVPDVLELRAKAARAEQLAEALREARDRMLGQVKWVACDCGCEGEKPADAVSIAWLRASALLSDQEEGHEQ